MRAEARQPAGMLAESASPYRQDRKGRNTEEIQQAFNVDTS